MTPERIQQLLLTADALETDARAMRSGAWQRSMIAGAAGIRELVGVMLGLLDAARERDTLREQNARLVEALASLDTVVRAAIDEAPADEYASIVVNRVRRALESADAHRILTSIRPKDPTNV